MSEPVLPPPPPGARVIDTGWVRFWRGDDGIVYDHTYISGRIEAEAMCRGVEAIRELTGGRPAPLLAWADKMGSPTREAREVFSGDEAARVISAMAVVVGSPVVRLVMTFAVRVAPPAYPVALFSTVEDAQAWCSGFLELSG